MLLLRIERKTDKDMKLKLLVIILCFICLLSGCKNTYINNLEKKDYVIDEVTINANINTPVKIVVVNDIHVQINDDFINSENKDFMDNRIDAFSVDGISTQTRWDALCDILGDADVSLIVFAGDIADFSSPSTNECIKNGLSKINGDYIYLRSDHDFLAYWQEDVSSEELVNRQNNICEYEPIFIKEMEEIIVIGINMSYSQISEDSIEKIKKACLLNKPIVIFTHVPINQEDSNELEKFSEEIRENRRLYWGNNTEYIPNENTQELLNIIYADDSPVVAVLAGHLHSKWDGKISNNAIEHVFAPTYEGNIGIVTIR